MRAPLLRAALHLPPPQALRFSHGRGERETRVTGDEPQGTMGRVQTAGDLPAFLCAHIFIKRETSGYEAGTPLSKRLERFEKRKQIKPTEVNTHL